jgi:hypothetical protein
MDDGDFYATDRMGHGELFIRRTQSIATSYTEKIGLDATHSMDDGDRFHLTYE